MSLTFADFSSANRRRTENATGFAGTHENWILTDWGCAAAGEVGELCNILKKTRRGDLTGNQASGKIADEIGDVVAYLDIIASKIGRTLEECVVNKFNRVSARVGWDECLGEASTKFMPGINVTGRHFYDLNSHREMFLVEDECCDWNGWILFRNDATADWITLRLATEEDLARINKADRAPQRILTLTTDGAG